MRNLRLRIQLLATLLVAGTLAAMVSAVLVSASRDVAARAETELGGRARALDEVLAIRGRQMVERVRLTSADGRLSATLSRGDRGAFRTELADRVRELGGEFGMLIGGDGRVLLSTETLAPTRVALPGLVARARDGGRSRSTLASAGRLFEMITVPLGGARDDAWLAIGFAIDGSLARQARELTGLEVSVLLVGSGAPTLLGTTLTAEDPAALRAGLAARWRLHETTFSFEASGREWIGVQRSFIPDLADVVLVLHQSVQDGMAPYRALRTSLLSVGGLALLLALVGAGLLAESITGPVRRLLGAARRIREGNYGEGVPMPDSDELRQLTVAFNEMQEVIAEREERISYQARYDELTGLPNRLLGLARLEEALVRARASGHPVAVFVVDLNSFGQISSALGHDIGDALLAQAAERLRASLDAHHVLARLEADEFLVVMEGTDAEAARETGVELLRLLAAGLAVRDVNITVGASIGVAAFPDHGDEAPRLLLRAAVARNEARQAQDGVAVYAEGCERRHVRQLTLLGDLRRAVRRDEMKLFVQPKLDLATRRISGVEALVRWEHPTLGFLGPGEFVPLAEQFGNVSLITDWALTAAIRECRLWQEEGLDLTVSVNLSGRDLQNAGLPAQVRALLRDHDLAARHLVLEVTEQALVHDVEHAGHVLEALRALGVRISIDDFGAGYSSLAQIKALPVDEIKIDRTFVMALPQDRADVAIVRAAIDLAHGLGLEVVAEGVENPSALRWLAAHACERAQGYQIARPMPAEMLADWVASYNARRTAAPADQTIAWVQQPHTA